MVYVLARHFASLGSEFELFLADRAVRLGRDVGLDDLEVAMAGLRCGGLGGSGFIELRRKSGSLIICWFILVQRKRKRQRGRERKR